VDTQKCGGQLGLQPVEPGRMEQATPTRQPQLDIVIGSHHGDDVHDRDQLDPS
jgi:hypothetical protein